MKKTFILLSAVIATFFTTVDSASAQAFDFTKDEEGDLFLEGTISYDCSASTAKDRLTYYLKSIFKMAENQLTIDEETGMVNVIGAVNSKYVYNPLAGEFKDIVGFVLSIFPDAEEKTFHYRFSNLSLLSTATGFANYNRTDPLRVVMKKYLAAKERTEDPALSKKEKKDAANEMKDLASSLSKASEALKSLMDKAQESIE